MSIFSHIDGQPCRPTTLVPHSPHDPSRSARSCRSGSPELRNNDSIVPLHRDTQMPIHPRLEREEAVGARHGSATRHRNADRQPSHPEAVTWESSSCLRFDERPPESPVTQDPRRIPRRAAFQQLRYSSMSEQELEKGQEQKQEYAFHPADLVE